MNRRTRRAIGNLPQPRGIAREHLLPRCRMLGAAGRLEFDACARRQRRLPGSFAIGEDRGWHRAVARTKAPIDPEPELREGELEQ
jgi:hypothetical protein